MKENLKQSEIDFIYGIHDPLCAKECLFPLNLKAPATWSDEECELVKIRNYQQGWANYSWMLVDDNTLSKKENFKKKQLAGTCYNIGSRGTGKSFDFIQMDIPINIMLNPGDESCLGSATAGFLKKVSNPILSIMREHPFFQIFKKDGKSEGIHGAPDLEIQSRHGHSLLGRNEKIDSPNPGEKFSGLHYKTLYYEESSFQSEAGLEKRIDSGSSLGVIERFSGIPDIRVGSPLGKILYDENNKHFLCRLPQFVKPDWDDNRRKEMAEKYNGESSLAYKLNVIGEIIEGATGFWDIQRLKKKSLDKDRKIKQFDIDKKKFLNFQQHIIIDRLPAEQIYCTADIGMGGRPTEIIILFYDGKKYKVVYNITLHKLTSREQTKIFAYIYKKMGSCFIGVDSTTDYQILDMLKNDYNIPQKHLIAVKMTQNIDIAVEKNEYGRVLRDKSGKPVIKKMITIDWAMQRLEYLFYEGFMSVPICNKFFKEFSSFIVINSGLRNTYDTSSTDDMHQAYQVFAITQWNNEFETLLNKNNTDQSDGCLGVI